MVNRLPKIKLTLERTFLSSCGVELRAAIKIQLFEKEENKKRNQGGPISTGITLGKKSYVICCSCFDSCRMSSGVLYRVQAKGPRARTGLG